MKKVFISVVFFKSIKIKNIFVKLGKNSFYAWKSGHHIERSFQSHALNSLQLIIITFIITFISAFK